jgi:hypothetical protein
LRCRKDEDDEEVAVVDERDVKVFNPSTAAGVASAFIVLNSLHSSFFSPLLSFFIREISNFQIQVENSLQFSFSLKVFFWGR